MADEVLQFGWGLPLLGGTGVSMMIYLICGMYYGYKVRIGRRESDAGLPGQVNVMPKVVRSHPHYRQWGNFSGLVIDGCRFATCSNKVDDTFKSWRAHSGSGKSRHYEREAAGEPDGAAPWPPPDWSEGVPAPTSAVQAKLQAWKAEDSAAVTSSATKASGGQTVAAAAAAADAAAAVAPSRSAASLRIEAFANKTAGNRFSGAGGAPVALFTPGASPAGGGLALPNVPGTRGTREMLLPSLPPGTGRGGGRKKKKKKAPRH